MSATLTYVGLDFETSGADYPRSAPIQIGLANETGLIYAALVGGWTFSASLQDADGSTTYGWSDAAENVHGIPRGRLDWAANAHDVDRAASVWMAQNAGVIPKNIIAVGWSVGALDFPYLRHHFPATARSMAYRSVDLNSLVMLISEAEIVAPDGRLWTYYRLKGHVRDRAEAMVFARTGQTAKWHDAGFDALAGLYAFEVLQDILRESAGWVA